jgi:2-phospho-L-lactate guanylyltransferase
MWAVVPIKEFGIAKQRLGDLLGEDERVALAEAMLRDVLAALRASERVTGVVIVSRDADVKRVAEAYAVRFVTERGNDLSAAVVQGGDFVAAQGADSMLVVHGDVPLLCAAEIDRLIDAHGDGPGLTLVPDRDGTGTNGLVVSPPDLIPFSYGANSFQAHHEAGRASTAPVRRVELEGLSLDIDKPEDVRCLLSYDRASATLDYLAEIQVESRLPPRHNVGQAVVG